MLNFSAVRILHFSDIHVGLRLSEVPLGKWFSKRAVGGLNLLLGRRNLFSEAREKLAALADFKRGHAIDLVIFTGDYTALGLGGEYGAARAAVEPLMGPSS